MIVRIKERSLLARLAAWKLGAGAIALTLGDTIHLHRARAADLLRDEAWMRHELKHVEQFRRHGFLRFLLLYGWESCRKGYSANRFEREARAAERSTYRSDDPVHLAERQGFLAVRVHEESTLPVHAQDAG